MAPTFAHSDQKVFILGDSLTHGFGLSVEEGLVNQLTNWFSGEGLEVTFINGGVSGDTTAGGLSRTDWSITDDINAVAISLGANDMLRGIPPKFSKENLSKMILKIKDKNLPILLIGITSIENFGSDYKNEFDLMFSELSRKFNISLYPNLMAPVIENENELSNYLQEDMLHPNEKGVEIIVQAILPTFIDFIESFSEK